MGGACLRRPSARRVGTRDRLVTEAASLRGRRNADERNADGRGRSRARVRRARGSGRSRLLIERALGPDGIGLLVVQRMPKLAEVRLALLPMAFLFAALPD